MWGVVIQFLISFAIKFGIPWLLKMFPSISEEQLKIVKTAVDDRKKVMVTAEEKLAKFEQTQTQSQNQSQTQTNKQE